MSWRLEAAIGIFGFVVILNGGIFMYNYCKSPPKLNEKDVVNTIMNGSDVIEVYEYLVKTFTEIK